MRYFKKIQGCRIYLSPMNPEDAEQYTIWLNDPDVTINLGAYSKAISLLSERAAIERMATEGYNFSIVACDGDKLIGNISLMDINFVSRTATLGLFIGDEENRGRGIGAEAIRMILKYGFEQLNLHNVMLTVNADNTRAIGCYKKVGFKEIGRRRAATFHCGKYWDVVYMDILRDELKL